MFMAESIQPKAASSLVITAPYMNLNMKLNNEHLQYCIKYIAKYIALLIRIIHTLTERFNYLFATL